MKVLDLFAGSGVGAGLQQLGIEDLGVEYWATARETRELNGLNNVYDNAWDIHKAEQLNFDGLWASPPCQTYSVAGKGAGNSLLQEHLNVIREGLYQSTDFVREYLPGSDDTKLVFVPMTYVAEYRPKFFVFEQVPSVLPLWEEFAKHARDEGYNVWTGVLNATQFGMAQDRRRAYLIGTINELPELPNLETKTMHDVLGWGFTHRPYPTLTGKIVATRSARGTQDVFRKAILAGQFKFKPNYDPKPSKIARTGIGIEYPPDAINISVEEAAILQGYPPNFRFAGNKTEIQQQIGNAVPPLMAETIIKLLI